MSFYIMQIDRRALDVSAAFCWVFRGGFFSMFNIGDKIVYPMHGAGIIESIEEREVLGERRQYYILKMPVGDMKVFIPTNNAYDIGVRGIIDFIEAEQVLHFFSICSDNVCSNWNRRYRENIARIKSGNIYEVAHVVKMLMCRDKRRGLSSGERKMLCNAKHILISELILAKEISQQDVEMQLEVLITIEEV